MNFLSICSVFNVTHICFPMIYHPLWKVSTPTATLADTSFPQTTSYKITFFSFFRLQVNIDRNHNNKRWRHHSDGQIKLLLVPTIKLPFLCWPPGNALPSTPRPSNFFPIKALRDGTQGATWLKRRCAGLQCGIVFDLWEWYAKKWIPQRRWLTRQWASVTAEAG